MASKDLSKKELKAAFDAKRLGGYQGFDPDELVLPEDPTHPLYDPRVARPPDESLARSIDQDGVLQPIRVWKDEEGRPLVVVGRRRTRAARLVKQWRKERKDPEPVLVPAVNTKGDPETLFGYSVTENELRVNDTPIQKARKAQRQANGGVPVATIATRMGVSQHTVFDWLTLVDLDSSVQKAVDDGLLSANAAKKFKGKTRDEQKTLLQDLLAKDQDSQPEVAKKRKGPSARDVDKEKGKVLPPTRKEIRARLEEKGLPKCCKALLTWVLTGE